MWRSMARMLFKLSVSRGVDLEAFYVLLIVIIVGGAASSQASRTQDNHSPQEDQKILTIEIEIPEPEVPISGPRYRVDETTHVVYVDEQNETGVLWAELEAINGSVATTRSLDGESSGPANFSVYLISRHTQHLAVLIDIEEITFEPAINCEYQELKFSTVGVISEQLLERKNGTSSSSALVSPEVSDQTSGESAEPEVETDYQQATSSSEQEAELTGSQTPVSEAIALVLNAPLNLTILDNSPAGNVFRIIDQAIDYLYSETCHELADQTGSATDAPKAKQRHQRRRKSGGVNSRNAGNKSRKGPGRKQQAEVERSCEAIKGQVEFRQALARKLSEQLEWDDFQVVCGRTRQLVIPMRSLKLSVSSDEFSPSSKFAIKYQFISDPRLLPAFDNDKYFCRNRKVIPLDRKCDGYDDCGDASDESVKICGYPAARGGGGQPASSQSARSARSRANRRRASGGSGSGRGREALKLAYFNGADSGMLQCCQSSQWQQAIGSSALNLHSLIGESMKLFSGPLFAPTKNNKDKPKRRVKRIVGGTQAHRGAWPGQASLQYELLEPLCHFCAGTLIHPQYVLTAGHCITKEGLGRGIKVVFGAHDLRQLNGSSTPVGIQTRYVDDAQIYPGVDVKHLSFDWENDMNNDIALLRLNAPVLITAHVAPACLPPFNTPLTVNTTCRSIGWGQTHGSGNSNLLKHLPLRVVDSSECSKELLDRDGDQREGGEKERAISSGSNGEFDMSNLDIYNNHTMICVNNDHGHGICQGDSGGPLYCDRQLSSGEVCTEIYGVASFIIQYATVGAMCAVENLPGIFGEVSSKTDWVSSTIKMFEQSYRLKYGQHTK